MQVLDEIEVGRSSQNISSSVASHLRDKFSKHKTGILYSDTVVAKT